MTQPRLRATQRDCEPIIVVTGEDRKLLEDDLFSLDRQYPIVVVTGVNGNPVLPFEDLARAIQGEHACYFVPEPGLLDELNQLLGRRLRVLPGFVRVFWPKLGREDDPAAHPGVPVLFGEPVAVAVEAFGYAFDLSRPRVRRARESQGNVVAGDLDLAGLVRLTARAMQVGCGARVRGGGAVANRGAPTRRYRRRRR